MLDELATRVRSILILALSPPTTGSKAIRGTLEASGTLEALKAAAYRASVSGGMLTRCYASRRDACDTINARRACRGGRADASATTAIH